MKGIIVKVQRHIGRSCWDRFVDARVCVFQYRMVKEALSERANLIDIAPHLAYPLPIMLPVYK